MPRLSFRYKCSRKEHESNYPPFCSGDKAFHDHFLTLSPRRENLTNEQFSDLRRNLRITSVEIADYAGYSRKLMLDEETGREPVAEWMVSVLRALEAKKGHD